MFQLSKIDHFGGPRSVANALDWLITLLLGGIVCFAVYNAGGGVGQSQVVQNWMIAVLLILHGLWWLTLREEKRRISGWGLVFVPFFMYMIASDLYITPIIWRAKEETLIFAQGLIVFWVAIHNLRTKNHVWAVVAIIVGAGLVSLVFGMYQVFEDPSLFPIEGWDQAPQYEGRASGTFGVPNSFAAMMSLLSLFLLLITCTRKIPAVTRVLCGYLTLIFFAGLVLSGSRGGWLGTAGALVLLPIFIFQKLFWRIAGTIILSVTIIVSALGLYQSVDMVKDRVDKAIVAGGEPSRKLMWRTGWEIFKAYPVWGSGTSSYELLFDRYRPPEAQINPVRTHNDYLNTLSDFGVVGFVLLFGPAAGIMFTGWRVWNRTPFLAVPKGRKRAKTPPQKLFLGGTLLGLTSYGIHLFVDFHLKIPALLMMAAIWLGLIIKFATKRGIVLRRGKFGASLMFLLCVLLSGILAYQGTFTFLASYHYREGGERLDDYLKNKDELKGNTLIINKIIYELEETIRWEPDHARAWSDLSLAILERYYTGNYERAANGRLAQEKAARAIELCDVLWTGYAHYGIALVREKWPADDAQAYFEKAISLAPTKARAWEYYAQYLSFYPGKQKEALKAAEEVIKLDPNNRNAIGLKRKLLND